mmetsp:Transcript_12983/g.28023  ORF Transcript_12983/g.28023 Transcript_12983/m.28023 type:complete len:325 (+) Transcript_12983:247-1221(+)
MSVRGRKFFDALRHRWMNQSRLRLPCPPYHSPEYWDHVYKDMDPDDVHEWGGFDLHSGLLEFRYEKLLRHGDGAKVQPVEGLHTTTFAECMGISQLSTPEEAIQRYDELQNDGGNESVLVLGCGTSKIGEQILMNSFVGPVLQVDISSKIIQLLTKRYRKYLEEASVKRMEFIVDDARGLTALSPESVGGGVLDKGLIDVLHCSADAISMEDDDDSSGGGNGGERGENDDIRGVVDSVHRALQPSRPFVFFSKSSHEYMLRRTLGSVQWNGEIRKKWMDIQVMKLVDLDVYLYRFVKADGSVETTATATTPRIRFTPSKKRRKR